MYTLHILKPPLHLKYNTINDHSKIVVVIHNFPTICILGVLKAQAQKQNILKDDPYAQNNFTAM